MINSWDQPARYSATRCGSFARGLLADGRRGRIIALFKSSFYLEADGAIACIGSDSLHGCSLNVSTTAPADLDWSTNGLRTGAPWRVLGGKLHVGGRYLIAMDEVEAWTTAAMPRHWNAMDVRRSVTELRQLCARLAPSEGLGRAVGCGEDAITDPYLRRIATGPLDGLRSWLTDIMSGNQTPVSDHPHGLQHLVGLGPGLTPSGDDFLCGVMFTLRALGHGDAAQQLWDRVRPIAADAGNAISFGHLAVAAVGGGSAPIDDLLGALLGGETGELRRHLRVIDTVGHTSGWDCVAGVLMAATCWLAASPAPSQ